MLGKFSVLNAGVDGGLGIQYDHGGTRLALRADSMTNQSLNESVKFAGSIKELTSRNQPQHSQRLFDSASVGGTGLLGVHRNLEADTAAGGGNATSLMGRRKQLQAEQPLDPRMSSSSLGQGIRPANRGGSVASLNYMNSDLQKIDSKNQLVIPALNYGFSQQKYSKFQNVL